MELEWQSNTHRVADHTSIQCTSIFVVYASIVISQSKFDIEKLREIWTQRTQWIKIQSNGEKLGEFSVAKN